MSRTVDGILVVDKPAGMTSHDVVASIRRRLPRGTKVGHTGTLDPFATGVLPIVVGKGTRLSQFLIAGRKQYHATVAFGAATDTGDCDGTIVERSPSEALATLDADTIAAALEGFVGTWPQVPPAHSAKKVDGERAYVLARRGEQVNLPAVEVTAHALRLLTWNAADGTATLDLNVSSGYYVRSLARDLGQRLGVAAHLTALCRTGSGDWSLDHAEGLASIVEAAPEALMAMLRPLSEALPAWPTAAVDASQIEAIRRGMPITADVAASPGAADTVRVRLLDDAGELVGLGKPMAGGRVHVDIVLV